MFMVIFVEILKFLFLVVYTVGLITLGYHIACKRLTKTKTKNSEKVEWINADWWDE